MVTLSNFLDVAVSNTVSIETGSSLLSDSGLVQIRSGDSIGLSGDVFIASGSSDAASVGSILIQAGDSASTLKSEMGGSIIVRAGSGPLGGLVEISGGISNSGSGGTVAMISQVSFKVVCNNII